MKYIICLIIASMILSNLAIAKDGVFISLPDKRVAVLSEGDLERNSIGSYSVVVFKDAALIDFEAGVVFSRDGTIFQDNGKPRVKFADITGDGTKELIISKLTAGSGNYLEVDVLRINAHSIRLLIRLNLNTKDDEIAMLKMACQRRRWTLCH